MALVAANRCAAQAVALEGRPPSQTQGALTAIGDLPVIVGWRMPDGVLRLPNVWNELPF